MPIDNGTIAGTTKIDELTAVLSAGNQDFFIDTYSFYLVALVMSGKSVFYGQGRFVNIFFAKSSDYTFPCVPSENAPEEGKEKYRQAAEEKIVHIKHVLTASPDHKNRNDDFYDIVSTLGLAARRAVTSFFYEMQDSDKRAQLIKNRRSNKITIRKTLQIRFWNEMRRCFDEKKIAFKKNGNGYYIYIPNTSLRTDPDEVLKNVDENGELGLPTQKSAYYEAFKEEGKQGSPRVYDDEQNEKERVRRDSWDIRRYRIYLVKQVGDIPPCQLKHLSPMKCYALHYGLCDRTPFLNMIQDQTERLHYERENAWSDQMIAGLFAQDPSIPEVERNRISRENVKNYRQKYANALIEWLCKEVPGLEKFAADDLVSAEDIRFEQIAIPFFRTHLPDMTKEELAGMSKEERAEYLHNAYTDFVDKEKTLRL